MEHFDENRSLDTTKVHPHQSSFSLTDIPHFGDVAGEDGSTIKRRDFTSGKRRLISHEFDTLRCLINMVQRGSVKRYNDKFLDLCGQLQTLPNYRNHIIIIFDYNDGLKPRIREALKLTQYNDLFAVMQEALIVESRLRSSRSNYKYLSPRN
ncbi:hypothetical protein HYPBUDRAFT_151799 [Hyphopichia burtonii NRRL Y-1933]|uniref:Uncharacterized protein n=1 Tax=Hyphopichia burtonii NRRL Y-1933 TaxID=984485 RepID=A0A1E4RTW1_9ASCO|nr:hypothetical protein HYPBUDRAFT_151799 [Hyphopichia burtonii NRRL Y-1933]ODV70505.1 hypothetical protein HYPBUDRAFT_151799 [Hyphopichia burtonii NRRL Y-1933]